MRCDSQPDKLIQSVRYEFFILIIKGKNFTFFTFQPRMENENNTKSTYILVQRLFPFSTILGVSERGRGRLVRRREEKN